jgi:excisionase family DNA binding protein
MEERQLSLSEVAGLMGVSERTVRRWIKSGKLRAYKPGRDYRIPESAFQEFVAESEISPKERGRSLLEPSLNDVLEEERRAEWDAAVRSARQLRERGRARMEDLLASWRDKRDRHALHGMEQLLQEANDAETELTHYLEEESTGRVRLDRVPITEWEEVRKASRFYGALVEMVQGAGLRVRTKGKAHEVKDAA